MLYYDGPRDWARVLSKTRSDERSTTGFLFVAVFLIVVNLSRVNLDPGCRVGGAARAATPAGGPNDAAAEYGTFKRRGRRHRRIAIVCRMGSDDLAQAEAWADAPPGSPGPTLSQVQRVLLLEEWANPAVGLL
jgi:hypothetical protein